MHVYLEDRRHTGFAATKDSKAASRPRIPTERSALGAGVQEKPKLVRKPASDSCRASVSTSGEDVAVGSARRTV